MSGLDNKAKDINYGQTICLWLMLRSRDWPIDSTAIAHRLKSLYLVTVTMQCLGRMLPIRCTAKRGLREGNFHASHLPPLIPLVPYWLIILLYPIYYPLRGPLKPSFKKKKGGLLQVPDRCSCWTPFSLSLQPRWQTKNVFRKIIGGCLTNISEWLKPDPANPGEKTHLPSLNGWIVWEALSLMFNETISLCCGLYFKAFFFKESGGGADRCTEACTRPALLQVSVFTAAFIIVWGEKNARRDKREQKTEEDGERMSLAVYRDYLTFRC